MVRGNMIRNCPVTVADIKNAHTIFGPDIGAMRGKTVRNSPAPVVSEYYAVPPEILLQNSDVDVTGDVMFVNRIPFLVTLGQKIKFTTAENISDRKAKTLLQGLQNMTSLYNKQNVNIATLFMDNEFEVLKPKLDAMSITLNTTATNDHVPEIERQIRVIKESVRAI